MDALGHIALRHLQEKGAVLRFFLRAAPGELLASSVLPSLSLLEIARLEILAGAMNGEPGAEGRACLDADTLERCSLEIARSGLASVSSVVVVLGLPGETTDTVIETARTALSICVASAISDLRFEWWQNLPGSPLHRMDSSQLTAEDRTTVRETIEIIRLLYDDLNVEGPDDFTRTLQ
jgi:hypothetical protein